MFDSDYFDKLCNTKLYSDWFKQSEEEELYFNTSKKFTAEELKEHRNEYLKKQREKRAQEKAAMGAIKEEETAENAVQEWDFMKEIDSMMEGNEANSPF